MKHGYAVMTLKLNNHHHNGLHLHHHGCRKCTNFGARQMLMLSLFFFNQECIVHNHYASPGQTANQHFYLGVVRLLCNSVHCK